MSPNTSVRCATQRELAGDDGHGLRRLGQLRRRIEDVIRPDVLRIERRTRGLELHVASGREGAASVDFHA
jgi:hypothetical protein